ncbi:molybdenum cofactor guanylyltransferase [Salsipaludibacter albus]|uniref:molybdenum cofactor guanylyltransferase n=1 Tax=Salsipaludibacter albus TaxID=2849650 RepID=UPI001EE3FFB3|nr:molybdenum cofactor guanylyltransferase [Salsipaludibacter albus]MBY5161677.1 molybdenum cofactor guanylyltransferase [Salsipaludibacter albus]
MTSSDDPSDLDPLDVVVLAGGRARRLGRDKSTVVVGGVRQVDRVVRLLAPLGGVVVLAAGPAAADREPSRTDGVVVVADSPGSSGPLGGIVAGLDVATTPLVAIVAVDLVHPSVTLLRALAREVRRTGGVGVVPVVDGRWQHLHAVVRRDLGPVLARAGTGAVGAALADAGVVGVEEDRWRAWAPDARPEVDIDTPDDLGRARRSVRGTAGTERGDDGAT